MVEWKSEVDLWFATPKDQTTIETTYSPKPRPSKLNGGSAEQLLEDVVERGRRFSLMLALQILSPPANPKSGGLIHEATQPTQDGHQEARRRIRAKRTNEEANQEPSNVSRMQPVMLNWLRQEMDCMRAEVTFLLHSQNMQQPQATPYQQNVPPHTQAKTRSVLSWTRNTFV